MSRIMDITNKLNNSILPTKLKPKPKPKVSVLVQLSDIVGSRSSNIEIKEFTGNWKLTDISIGDKPSYWHMQLEIEFTETIPNKQTNFERWALAPVKYDLITKTMWVPEELFEIKQTYEFGPKTD